jgi:hypothetical protein
LVFIFLAVQIWLLWRDIDKSELKITTFVNESFFKKNCAYVFSFSIFFILHEFFEGITLPGAVLYFEFFEVLALVSLVLFAYGWYGVLKAGTRKKPLHRELTYITRH